MRSLTILASMCLVLSAVVISQAKTNYAYVANNSGNTVTVINMSNHTVAKTITVGTAPFGVAVNQAGTYAYVTNQTSNNVSVISTSTNSVVATISVQSNPIGIALTPDGKTAYVANENSNSVSVINTGTKTVTATIPVASLPMGVAVTPNGTFVYVTGSGSNNVSVISVLTHAVVATIPVGAGPVTIAISPDGTTAYVSNYGTKGSGTTVSVIRTADNTVVNTITVPTGPWGAALSADGHWLGVPQYDEDLGNVLTAFDTQTLSVTRTIAVGNGPRAVAVSEDSNFAYVVSDRNGANQVEVISTQDGTIVATLPGIGGTGVAVMGTMKVSTVAGGYLGDKGLPTSAALDGPFNTVQDKAGNYYVSDRYKHRIRKITPTGIISTFAGTGICGYNGENMAATKAMLCNPTGLMFDSAGNLYVADDGNARVRKISAKGSKITTVAGTGVYGYSGDGGLATSATLRDSWFIAFDTKGNMYFTELSNNIVRMVNSSGTISTYAGTGAAGFSGDGGPAISATMDNPRGIAFDTTGNLYIADTLNDRVRIVSAAGTINTFAGTGNLGCGGDGGPALSANVGPVRGVTVNNAVLYIANGGCNRVRAVDLITNTISTLAGSSVGYDGDNNPPLSSRFNLPVNTLFDAAGNVLVNDGYNGRLRKLSGGLVTTFAGGYLGDGQTATLASLVTPEAIAIDKSNNLYIADWAGHRIRKVSGGKISTIAGTGVNGYSGDNGPAINAMLNFPQGVAVDSNGNVFIADEHNYVVRKVNTTGTITTFAADPNFCDLAQMATDSGNNLYVADDCTSVIFKITPAGVVSIVAGVPFTYGYNGDGILATTADLNTPVGVAVDSSGNIFIADTYNSRLRMVDASGIIHTIAGDGNCNYSGDGKSATKAEMCWPYSVAVTKGGTIYFTDPFFIRVREITGGIIAAFAGSRAAAFNGDGLWPLWTALDDPVAVAVDSKGAVYVLDDVEHRVRKIQ